MANKDDDWFLCRNCGTEVNIRAKVCPECGADDETGWKDEYERGQSVYGGEDDFDYDEFVENEFGNKSPVKPKGMKWWVWVLALVVIGALLFLYLR